MQIAQGAAELQVAQPKAKGHELLPALCKTKGTETCGTARQRTVGNTAGAKSPQKYPRTDCEGIKAQRSLFLQPEVLFCCCTMITLF